MDKNLIFIMIAASVCGSYKNEANRPEPFQGRFAKAIKNHRIPKTIPKPHHLSHYGVISASTGNIYKISYAMPLRHSMIKLLNVYIIILLQGQKKLQIIIYANSLGMQAIVSMTLQHLVRTRVKVGG